jgi:hypothetical protein
MTSLGSKGRKLTLHCDGLMCGKKRIKIVASKSEDTNSTSSRRFPDQRARLAKGHCSDAERRWINWRLVFRLKWSMERGQVNLRSENELTLREMWEVGCTRLGQQRRNSWRGCRCDDVTNGNLWATVPATTLASDLTSHSAAQGPTLRLNGGCPNCILLEMVGRRVRHLLLERVVPAQSPTWHCKNAVVELPVVGLPMRRKSMWLGRQVYTHCTERATIPF